MVLKILSLQAGNVNLYQDKLVTPVKRSLYSSHVFNFLLEDGCGNSALLVSVAGRLDIWKQRYVQIRPT